MTVAPRLQPLRMQVVWDVLAGAKDARDEVVIAAVRRKPPALAGPRAARRGPAATADRHTTRDLALDCEREKPMKKPPHPFDVEGITKPAGMGKMQWAGHKAADTKKRIAKVLAGGRDAYAEAILEERRQRERLRPEVEGQSAELLKGGEK